MPQTPTPLPANSDKRRTPPLSEKKCSGSAHDVALKTQ